MWLVGLTRLLAFMLIAGGRGPAAAAALGLPAAPVDHSADQDLELSIASALESVLDVEHTEIASELVVGPAYAAASTAVHKVVLLDAEHLPPLDKVMAPLPYASISLTISPGPNPKKLQP